MNLSVFQVAVCMTCMTVFSAVADSMSTNCWMPLKPTEE